MGGGDDREDDHTIGCGCIWMGGVLIFFQDVQAMDGAQVRFEHFSFSSYGCCIFSWLLLSASQRTYLWTTSPGASVPLSLTLVRVNDWSWLLVGTRTMEEG